MKIILNPGHTRKGAGSGAVGYVDESEETRKVVNAVKRYLEMKGHTVILDSVEYATSQSTALFLIAEQANKHEDADLFVSIHFNSGKGTGAECYTWKGERTAPAVGVCKELEKIGFVNRGVKDGSGLYVIKKTTMKALLIEVCFVDNRKDCDLYKKCGVPVIAQAITRGILK